MGILSYAIDHDFDVSLLADYIADHISLRT